MKPMVCENSDKGLVVQGEDYETYGLRDLPSWENLYLIGLNPNHSKV